MSSFIKFPAIILAVFLALTVACSDGKTGIASLRVSKDFEGKAESVNFKGGSYGAAIVMSAFFVSFFSPFPSCRSALRIYLPGVAFSAI